MAPSNARPDWLRLLADGALRQLSGAAVFARGQAYAGSGAVESLQSSLPEPGEPAAVQAVVVGTQPYQVRVCIDDADDLDGECDCPHAQSANFCKHLVAVSLAWRGALGGAAPAQDPQAAKTAANKVAAAAKRASTKADKRQVLRRFLQSQSADALAERLWAWAEDDRHLMAELKAWSAEHSAAGDPKAMRSAIAKLLRNRSDFLDWRQSTAYAHRAAKVLPLLKPWLARDPAQLLELCDHALRCIYKVAENADDSDGEIGALAEQVVGLLTEALRAAAPAASWVERWFALMKADPWGVWDENAILAAAGPAVLARYAEQARRDWHDWQTRHVAGAKSAVSAAGLDDDTPNFQRYTLRRRYLNSLSMQGDALALREAMADSAQHAHEFGDLVALCEAHGGFREALQWAEAGVRQHPGDYHCEDALLRCYERDGWDQEALALWRRRLHARPDAATYRAVLTAAERAGHERAHYRAELFNWAEQREQAEREAERKYLRGGSRRFGGVGRNAETAVRRVDLRVSWHLADGEPQQALALVQQAGTGCGLQTLQALAHKLPAENDADAVHLLQRLFDDAMGHASSPYAAPLALVRHILARMPPLQQPGWLAELRTQYKPKRNFMAGLPK